MLQDAKKASDSRVFKAFGPSRDQKLPESNLRSAIINKTYFFLREIVLEVKEEKRNELPSCSFSIREICM